MKLDKNSKLYAAKTHTASDISTYHKKNVKESNDSCDIRNITWFGSLEVANSYQTKTFLVRQWKTIRSIDLIDINIENEGFFVDAFLKTKKKLEPITSLTLDKKHPYLNMTNNERCLYEFKFAFGYMSIKEQYEFIALFSYLVDHKHIRMTSRQKDLIPSYQLKMMYYHISISNKNKKYQRFSVYHIDKIVMRNLCKVISYRYDGLYQKNALNFWNPNFLILERFRKNIEEYILFRPQEVLNTI